VLPGVDERRIRLSVERLAFQDAHDWCHFHEIWPGTNDAR
jgi:hypothetical protein